MTRQEIVDQLAREGRVEEIIRNVAHTSRLAPDLQDLAQMVYLAVLTYDEDEIVDLWENDEIGFFLTRIVISQYHSRDSPWRDEMHHLGFRHHGLKHGPLTDNLSEKI